MKTPEALEKALSLTITLLEAISLLKIYNLERTAFILDISAHWLTHLLAFSLPL